MKTKFILLCFVACSFATSAQKRVDYHLFNAPFKKALASLPVENVFFNEYSGRYKFGIKTFKPLFKPQKNSCEQLLLNWITDPAFNTLDSEVKDIADMKVKKDSLGIVSPLHKLTYGESVNVRSIMKIRITRKGKESFSSLFFVVTDGSCQLGVPKETDQKMVAIFGKIKTEVFQSLQVKAKTSEVLQLQEKVFSEETGINIDALYSELQRLKKEDPKTYALLCDN